MRKITKFISLLLLILLINTNIPLNVWALQYSETELLPKKDYGSLNSEIYLTSEEIDVQKLKKTIFDGISVCQSTIDLSSFNMTATQENLSLLTGIAYYNMPEAFHISQLGYASGGNKIISLTVKYKYTYQKYSEMYQKMQDVADKMTADLVFDNTLCDAEKALLLHDRLAVWNKYNFGNDTENQHDAYGALVERISVCQGYSMAYMYLLEKVGIKSEYCSSDKLNHGWNIVYIDNIPFHVDVTHDDSRNADGAVSHDNFLISTKTYYNNSNSHKANDYNSSPVDKRYENYVWKNSESAFQYINGKLYYTDNVNEKLCRYENGNSTVLHDINSNWKAGTNSYYADNFSYLFAYEENALLYSKADGIYIFFLETNQEQKVFTPKSTVSGNSVFGFIYEDGYLICSMSTSPVNVNHGNPSNTGCTVEKSLLDLTNPRANIEISNNISTTQTATFTFFDDSEIEGYYWGNDPIYENNTFFATGESTDNQTIAKDGTYYLTVKDISGKVSETSYIKTVKITLNPNNGSVSPSYIIAKENAEITLPDSTKKGYIFKGWSYNNLSQEPQKTVIAEKNHTYYAIWEKIPAVLQRIEIKQLPEKSVYYIGDTLNTSGLQLKLIYSDETEKTVYDGFSTSGFSSVSAGKKTVVVNYNGKTDSFSVEVKTPKITLSTEKIEIQEQLSEGVSVEYEPSSVDIVWTSSDEKIAEHVFGLISCKKAGTAKIKAQFNYNGISYSDELTVDVQHNIVTDYPVAPTTTATGLTQGEHCSICKEIIIAQTVIPKLSKIELSDNEKFKLENDFIFTVGEITAEELKSVLSAFCEITDINGNIADLSSLLTTGMKVQLKENQNTVDSKTVIVLCDTDFDGKVTASDARLALRASVGLEKFDTVLIFAADCDKDKKIKSSDARIILRTAVGLEKIILDF